MTLAFDRKGRRLERVVTAAIPWVAFGAGRLHQTRPLNITIRECGLLFRAKLLHPKETYSALTRTFK